MNTQYSIIELNDLRLNVTQKNIKNIHLRVHSPEGNVTISAPLRINLATIRRFVITKLGWIQKQQTKIKHQKRAAPREYITNESHDYLGQKYLLQIFEQNTASKVILKPDTIELYIRKNSSITQRKKALQNWYRQQLKILILQAIESLEKKMSVKVSELRIKTMKTRWGTCNPKAKRIWLNTELAKKSIEHIEYVLIHEMVHLLERKHNKKFKAHMDKFSPQWKHLKKELNRSALRNVD